MAEINIISIPRDNRSMGGDNIDGVRRNMANRASGNRPPYEFINNFMDNQDLFDRVKAILDTDPDHCLKRLEINAHGSPGICDGIGGASLSGFISKYRALKDQLCDETHILFTGCNTGLKAKKSTHPTLPEQVVTALPFNASDFNIHLKVWGLAGYGLQGRTAMEQNMEINKTTNSKRHHADFPGGRDATGRQCWNSFKNW